MKASRRDLAFACSSFKNASTTVSATMILAARAGIRVFATGGIGGVHRDLSGNPSIDISADLTELGRTPVTVVCSGVKSILDIPSTLEVLETQGVPVLSYQTNDFPAFFTAGSGTPSPQRVDTVDEVARMIHSIDQLGLQQGIVVAVPNPEPFQNSDELNKCIDQALTDAVQDNIQGPKITPYLLAAVNRLTGGASLKANKNLVFHNAKIAASIAVSYAKLQQNQRYNDKDITARNVLIFGGVAFDSISTIDQNPPLFNASNPGTTSTSIGGVGCNVAKKLAIFGENVQMMSVVANDRVGKEVIEGLHDLNIGTSGIHILNNAEKQSCNTASYTAIHDKNGELVISTADMNIFDSFLPENVRSKENFIMTSSAVMMDANFPIHTIIEVSKICNTYNVPLFFDPTSDYKAKRSASCVPYVNVVKPNITELLVLLDALNKNNGYPLPECFDRVSAYLNDDRYHDASNMVEINDIIELSKTLWSMMNSENILKSSIIGRHVITSIGHRGVVWISNTGDSFHISSNKHKEDVSSQVMINSNGAGDVFCAALISEYLKEESLCENTILHCVNQAFDHVHGKK
jgi:pseudouridylate synthase / pseudouridine kinase